MLQSCRLSDVPFGRVLSDARTLPFLCSAQVFRIRDIERIKKEDVEELELYSQKPTAGTYLIFETPETEKKMPVVDFLRKIAEVHLLEDSGKGAASAALIQRKLKAAGKAMTPEAKERIRESMGDEPGLLESALNQMVSYAGEAKDITGEMVEAFEEKISHADGFDLANAIASKRPGRALELLKELSRENEQDMIWLIGLLHWQLRRLWIAKMLMEEGSPEAIIVKKCSVSPRMAGYFMKEVKRFRRPDIERAIDGLFFLDWKLKTGLLEGPAGLEAWVVELTSAGQ